MGAERRSKTPSRVTWKTRDERQHHHAGRNVAFSFVLCFDTGTLDHVQRDQPRRTNKKNSLRGSHLVSGGQNKVKDTPVPSKQAPVTLRPRDVTTG